VVSYDSIQDACTAKAALTNPACAGGQTSRGQISSQIEGGQISRADSDCGQTETTVVKSDKHIVQGRRLIVHYSERVEKKGEQVQHVDVDATADVCVPGLHIIDSFLDPHTQVCVCVCLLYA
jgi:hypothetical protein